MDFTKKDVLEAIGKHRVRQVSIETELVIEGKVNRHPTEIGVGEANRAKLEKMLTELEAEGEIVSYGIDNKTYELAKFAITVAGG